MSKISLTDLVNLQNQTTAVNAINANNAAITTALDNTLSRDGTSPNTMSADLDMNSNHILNLPTPSSNYDPVRLIDVSTINGSGITVSSLPAGGSTSQVLAKNSGTDFDVSWQTEQTLPSGGSTGQILTKNTSTDFDWGWSSSPTLTSINTSTGSLTLPTTTDTLVGLSTTGTLTNKSIDGSNNTLTNIPVSALNSGTSASSSTFWRGDGTWGSPPTGTFIFLEQVTASNSTQLASSASWSGYSVIQIEMFNIIPVTNDVTAELQVHASAAYQSTNYQGQSYVPNTTAIVDVGTSSFVYLTNINSLGNSNWGLSGTFKIFRPNDSIYKIMTGYGTYGSGASTVSPITIGYSWNSNTVVDGMKIAMSSGNISSGFIRIYGIV